MISLNTIFAGLSNAFLDVRLILRVPRLVAGARCSLLVLRTKRNILRRNNCISVCANIHD
jgi:hypothetical protein